MVDSTYVFEEGSPVDVGNATQQGFVFGDDDQLLSDNGTSGLVFVDGRGIGGVNQEIIDDWEDGNKITKSSNWGGWSGATGQVSIVGGLNGSANAGQLEGLAGSKTDLESSRSSPVTPSTFSYRIRPDTKSGVIFDSTGCNLVGPNGQITDVVFDYDNVIRTTFSTGLTGVGSWSVGTEYLVEFDVDFPSNTYDVTISVSGTVQSSSSNLPFAANNSDADLVRARVDNQGGSNPQRATFDDIIVSGI